MRPTAAAATRNAMAAVPAVTLLPQKAIQRKCCTPQSHRPPRPHRQHENLRRPTVRQRPHSRPRPPAWPRWPAEHRQQHHGPSKHLRLCKYADDKGHARSERLQLRPWRPQLLRRLQSSRSSARGAGPMQIDHRLVPPRWKGTKQHQGVVGVAVPLHVHLPHPRHRHRQHRRTEFAVCTARHHHERCCCHATRHARRLSVQSRTTHLCW